MEKNWGDTPNSTLRYCLQYRTMQNRKFMLEVVVEFFRVFLLSFVDIFSGNIPLTIGQNIYSDCVLKRPLVRD